MKANLKIVHWAPRVVAILTILFVSLFAFDSFSAEKTFWKQILDFTLHLVPSFLLISILILAWKSELLGGIIFILLGLILSPFVFNMNYAHNQSVAYSLLIILIITFPLILSGILFVISHYLKKKRKKYYEASYQNE